MNRAPASARLRTSGFIAGTLGTQFVNSALHLAQPLLIAELTGSIGHAALFSAFDTGMHMLGTFLGGWPVDRFGAKRVLFTATLARAFALSAIPFMMWQGSLTVFLAMAWYTVDAFARGFNDCASYTLPLSMAGHDRAALDRLNSRFELAFEGGGVIGPLALSGLMLGFAGYPAHAAIAIGFALSAVLFLFIPKLEPRPASAASNRLRQGSWQGLKVIFSDRRLLVVCISYMLFNIYPLRKLMSASFAKVILLKPALAGLIGASFAAGGLLAALLFPRLVKARTSTFWLKAGIAGFFLLAGAWMPSSLGAMAVAAFCFSLGNTGARLELIRARQELTPLDSAGGVTAVSRFAANLVSVLGKGFLGFAFNYGAGPRVAFGLVSLLLIALAAVQSGLLVQLNKIYLYLANLSASEKRCEMSRESAAAFFDCSFPQLSETIETTQH